MWNYFELLAGIFRQYPHKQKLRALFIRRGQPFPEVELFIKASVQRYICTCMHYKYLRICVLLYKTILCISCLCVLATVKYLLLVYIVYLNCISFHINCQGFK